jgi:DNA-binding transcriptional MerR regulator
MAVHRRGEGRGVVLPELQSGLLELIRQQPEARNVGGPTPRYGSSVQSCKIYSYALDYIMTLKQQSVFDTFDIHTAAKLSRLSKPMLDYLCRTDLVVPAKPRRRGRGRRRQYTFRDVVILRVIAKLLSSGISVRRLRKGLKILRERADGLGHRSEKSYLVTDGREVFVRRSIDVLESLTNRGQMAFAFLVDIASVHTEIISNVEKTRASGRR